MEVQVVKVRPLHDRVLIKRIDLEVQSKGGIILGSEIEKERDTGFGKVVAVGDGKKLDTSGTPTPMTVKRGDIIAFNERIPTKVTYLGEELYTLRESDIFFIVKDENITEKPYQKEGGEYTGTVRSLS